MLYRLGSNVDTVEPVLKDHLIGHENVVFQDRWSLVTGSIVLNICQKKTGLSRQVVSHNSGLSRQVPLYRYL